MWRKKWIILAIKNDSHFFYCQIVALSFCCFMGVFHLSFGRFRRFFADFLRLLSRGTVHHINIHLPHLIRNLWILHCSNAWAIHPYVRVCVCVCSARQCENRPFIRSVPRIRSLLSACVFIHWFLRCFNIEKKDKINIFFLRFVIHWIFAATAAVGVARVTAAGSLI